MVQSLAPDAVDGISIDVDVTQADEQGDQATFLYPIPPEEQTPAPVVETAEQTPAAEQVEPAQHEPPTEQATATEQEAS
jgi:hypothetical protein